MLLILDTAELYEVGAALAGIVCYML